MIAKQPAPLIISVLNYHLDGYAHVNNARYLEFLEAARWHFFAEHNLLLDLRLAQLVVSRADIRYRKAACLGDVLHIHSQISSLQSRQIVLSQRIEFADTQQICATADITLMPTSANGKMCRLPDALLLYLTNLMESS